MTEADEVAFSILGRALRARGLSPGLAARLRDAWDLPAPSAPPHAHSIEIDAGPGVLPPLAWEEEADARLDRATLRVRRRGDAWETGEGAWRVRADWTDEGVRIAVRCPQGVAEEDGAWPALHLFVSEAVRADGLLPLHAAVVAREGRAVALLGSSGTGKSTALARLAAGGWTPLAEDFAWLDAERMEVRGWDRGVRLWPEGVRRFASSLPTNGWTLGADGKLFLPFAALRGEDGGSVALGEVVLLERGLGLAPGSSPVAPRDLVRALWESAGVPLRPAAREAAERAVSAVLQRVPARRLVLGEEPPEL